MSPKEVVKDLAKDLVSAVSGALDPDIQKLAIKIANQLPKDSVLRKDWSRRVIGVLRTYAERLADKYEEPGPIIGDVLSSFTNSLSIALGHPMTAGAELAASGWLDAFLKESIERLKTAQDPRAEMDKIKIELEMRRELIKLVTQVHDEIKSGTKKDTKGA